MGKDGVKATAENGCDGKRRGLALTKLTDKNKAYISTKKQKKFVERAAMKKKLHKALKKEGMEDAPYVKKSVDQKDGEKKVKRKRADPFQKELSANAKREAELQKQREEREAQQKAAKEAKERREKERRSTTKKMRKQTPRGQPLMRHRVELMLAKLEK